MNPQKILPELCPQLKSGVLKRNVREILNMNYRILRMISTGYAQNVRMKEESLIGKEQDGTIKMGNNIQLCGDWRMPENR